MSKLLILFAILCGLIYVSPNIYYVLNTTHYNPLSINNNINNIDSTLYVSGISEEVQGNILPSDLAVYEHKKDYVSLYNPVPFMITGALSYCIGGVYNLLIISSFIFAIIYFIIFYYLTFFFIRDEKLCIICSIILLFFYRLFIVPPLSSVNTIYDYYMHIIFNTGPSPAYLWFSQIVHPQASLLFFLLAILFLLHGIEWNKIYLFAITGIMFSILFYSYFYYWTYFIVILCISIGWFYLKKNYLVVKGILISLLVGVISGVPFFYGVYHSASKIISRSGIEYGRYLEIITIPLIMVYLVMYLLLTKENKKELTLFSLLYLPILLVMNIQLLTGYTIQNNHYMSRCMVPILIVISFVLLSKYIVKLKHHNIMKNIILFSLIILAINIQISDILKLSRYVSFQDSEYELINWLNANTTRETVILTTSLKLNMYIPAYTFDNVYFPYSATTLSTQDELEERFILTYKLFNYSSGYVSDRLLSNSIYKRNNPNSIKQVNTSIDFFLTGYIFADGVYIIERGIFKRYGYNLTKVNNLIYKYNNTDFDTYNLLKYRVDYIILVNNETILWNNTKEVYANKNYTVVQVI